MKNDERVERTDAKSGQRAQCILLGVLFILGVFICIYQKQTDSGQVVVKYTNSRWLSMAEDNCSYKDKKLDSDQQTATMSYDMTGIDTLYEIEADKDLSLSLQCTNKVTKGKAKLVLVLPDAKVHHVVCENADKQCLLKLKKGQNRLRFVGDQAVGNISLTFKNSKGVKIKCVNDT